MSASPRPAVPAWPHALTPVCLDAPAAVAVSDAQLQCRLSGSGVLAVQPLGHMRFRVTLLPASGARATPRTWLPASAHSPAGIDRSAAPVPAVPGCVASATAAALSDGAAEVELRAAAGAPPQLVWRYNAAQIAADFAPAAYRVGPQRLQHYMCRGPPDREFYYGVGEAAGSINRYGGRFRLGAALDAMGYEADPRRGTSDPLYKHYPM